MTNYVGDFPASATVYIPWNTFDSSGAAVTMTGLAGSSINVYKDGSTTQRSASAGFALLDTDGIDFDSVTGIHGISIDLSDDTDAGFYAAGSEYWVVINSITVDSQTVSFIAATFSIERDYNNRADAVLKRDWASVSGAASRSLLYAAYFLRNKWSISGTTLTVYDHTDSASAWTSTLTTASGTDPITTFDPD